MTILLNFVSTSRVLVFFKFYSPVIHWIAIFNVFLFFSSNANAQEDSIFWNLNTCQDPFWQPHSNTMDGFSLWLLRQKLSIQGTQTILQSEADLNHDRLSRFQITNYLPIFSSQKVSSMVGTRYSTFNLFSANQSLNKKIQHVWLWFALQYRFEQWNFIVTTENYLKGDEDALYDKTGNNFFTVAYCGYELNPNWNIVVMAGYDRQRMENSVLEKPLIGIEARFQPSQRLKFLFGVPTIFAMEWTASKNSDIGVNCSVSGDTELFVQHRITKKLNFSIRYSDELFKDTYFSTKDFISKSDQISFNNLSFRNNRLLAEIGYWTTDLIGINLGFGYNFQKSIQINHNSSMINDQYSTKPYLAMTMRIQYLKH